MLALVTRPQEDAESVSVELRARGLAVMLAPLLEIVPLDQPVSIDGAQAILATSANGVRALARRSDERGLPVLAVGDASARCARAHGYQRVESAGGDVESLAALAVRRLDPAAGPLLHVAATVTAGDLSGRLAAAGFTVRRLVLYEARPADRLPDAVAASLADGAVGVALFFSPRTAATFATLVAQAGLADACASVTAYGLSAAVAQALAPLPFARIRVADVPTQAALLAALDHDLAPSAL